MNKIKYISPIIVFIFMVSSVNTFQAGAQIPPSNVTTSNQCTTPTITFPIQGEYLEKYNVTSFTVAKGACVAVSFINVDSIFHTFTIAPNATYGINAFQISLHPYANKTVNFKAPDVNIIIKYYCAIADHELNGMYGFLTVGTVKTVKSSTKTSTPSFEAPTIILAFATLVILSSKFKQVRK